MREETERILTTLGRMAVHSPAIQLAVGYLLYDPGRVQFVHQLAEDRVLAMTISAHRRIEIPMAPWQGFVRGVPISDPMIWIQAARSQLNQMISVRVSTDDAQLLHLLQPLIQPDRVRLERSRLEHRMEHLRQGVDESLDIYNEVRHLIGVDPERREELSKFLQMAESEMQDLGRELKALKEHLGTDG